MEIQTKTLSPIPLYVLHADPTKCVNVAFPDAATIIDITSRVLEDEGGTAFFECVADSNPVTPDMVTWTRSGYDMSAKTKQRSEGSKSYLTVYELVREDTGTFKCIADNGIGDPATRNAKLIVKCKFSDVTCDSMGLFHFVFLLQMLRRWLCRNVER